MFDIIIVGGGIVGLALANSLAQIGISILIIEAKAFAQETDLNRVVALSRSSENLLRNLSVWPLLKPYARPITQMKVWDQAAFAEFELNAQILAEPDLGHIVPNSVLISALYQELQGYAHVTLLAQCSVITIVPQDDSVSVVTNLGTFFASGLAAADGANSKIRELLQISVNVVDYQQTAIVATIETEKAHQGCAFQRFKADGPLALLPLFSPKQSSIVWSTTPLFAKELTLMDKEQFSAILTKEILELGKINLISERLSFNLQQQRVRVYGKLRCVLLGDAAHVMHPLAGWGVNLGLLDIGRLVECIAEAKIAKRDLFSLRVLAKYQRACKANNWVMLMFTDSMKKLFASENTAVVLGRNFGMQSVAKIAWFKRMIMHIAKGDAFGAPKLARRNYNDY